MSLDALISELERTLNPGTPMTQAVMQLEQRGFACHDTTGTSKWTVMQPARTTSCSLLVRGMPFAWQVDVILPEDANGKLIRLFVNKNRINL